MEIHYSYEDIEDYEDYEDPEGTMLAHREQLGLPPPIPLAEPWELGPPVLIRDEPSWPMTNEADWPIPTKPSGGVDFGEEDEVANLIAAEWYDDVEGLIADEIEYRRGPGVHDPEVPGRFAHLDEHPGQAGRVGRPVEGLGVVSEPGTAGGLTLSRDRPEADPGRCTHLDPAIPGAAGPEVWDEFVVPAAFAHVDPGLYRFETTAGPGATLEAWVTAADAVQDGVPGAAEVLSRADERLRVLAPRAMDGYDGMLAEGADRSRAMRLTDRAVRREVGEVTVDRVGGPGPGRSDVAAGPGRSGPGAGPLGPWMSLNSSDGPAMGSATEAAVRPPARDLGIQG